MPESSNDITATIPVSPYEDQLIDRRITESRLPLGCGWIGTMGERADSAFTVPKDAITFTDQGTGNTVRWTARLIRSEDNLSSFLHHGAAASFNGIFTSASAEYGFTVSENIHNFSTVLAIRAQVLTGVQIFPQEAEQLTWNSELQTLRSSAKRISAAEFVSKYGDRYINSYLRGADFAYIYRYDFKSESDKEEFEGRFSGSVLTVKGSAELERMLTTTAQVTSVSADFSSRGGSGVTISDKTNWGEVLKSINAFISSIKKGANDVVIGATSISYASIKGINTLVDGNIPTANVSIHRELTRIRRFRGRVSTLRNNLRYVSTNRFGIQFSDSSFTAQLESLAERIHQADKATEVYAQKLVSDGTVLSDDQLQGDPSYAAASRANELSLFRTLRDFSYAVPRSHRFSVGHTGLEKLNPRADGNLATGWGWNHMTAKWTRVTFRPRLQRNGDTYRLFVDFSIMEGEWDAPPPRGRFRYSDGTIIGRRDIPHGSLPTFGGYVIHPSPLLEVIRDFGGEIRTVLIATGDLRLAVVADVSGDDRASAGYSGTLTCSYKSRHSFAHLYSDALFDI